MLEQNKIPNRCFDWLNLACAKKYAGSFLSKCSKRSTA